MALIVKNKLVKEDILDENGNKIGEIKFNPDDSTIMKKLSEILEELSQKINKMNKYKEINLKVLNKPLNEENITEINETVGNLVEYFDLEYHAVENSIAKLEEIFGKETMDCITGGSKDVETLLPLIEFITPYIQENRKAKVKKYINQNDDVME